MRFAHQNLLDSCPAWTIGSDGMKSEWHLQYSLAAFGLMTQQVALLAERE